MKVPGLVPTPLHRELFKRSVQKFLPRSSGCYVLATFLNEVLYIGLTINLQRRMAEHLDSPLKIKPTPIGKAVFFYWTEFPAQDINLIERTWMNIHIQSEGKVPILNKIFSPVST